MSNDHDQYRQNLSMMAYPALAEEFQALDEEKKRLRKELNWITDKYDILTTEILPDKLAEDGFKNVSLSTGQRFQPSQQAHCSTAAGAKEALFKWLHEHGFEDLVTEVVNPGTLKAFIKEQKGLGNPVPDEDIVKYQPYTRVTLVKS